MSKSAISVFCFSMLLLLAACSGSPIKLTMPSSPSFEKSREELLRGLDAAAACCDSFDQLSYVNIEKIPFDKHFIIDEKSQVLDIDGMKSYVLAISIPALGGLLDLDILSTETIARINSGGVFSPEILTLDENHRLLAAYAFGRYFTDDEAVWQLSGIRGKVPLPRKTRYIVFRTMEPLLNRRSAYVWDGGRTKKVRDYEAAVRNPPGVYRYSTFGNLVVKPHLPVGRIWIGLGMSGTE